MHGDPIQYDDPSGEGIIARIARRLLGKQGSKAGLYGSLWAITKGLIGTRATYVLGNAYIRENFRDPDDVEINRAIARLKDPDLPIDEAADNFAEQMIAWRVRPDIVDHTLGREQFYEIKAVGQIAGGAAEVAAYDLQLQLRYPNISYAKGQWRPIQKLYLIDFAYGIPVPLHIRAWNQDDGLIVYETNHNEDVVLAAYIASEVIQEVAAHLARRQAAAAAAAKAGRSQGQWGVYFDLVDVGILMLLLDQSQKCVLYPSWATLALHGARYATYFPISDAMNRLTKTIAGGFKHEVSGLHNCRKSNSSTARQMAELSIATSETLSSPHWFTCY